MQFPDSFFEDEVRDGFYVPALMKRSWAAQMEVLSDIAKVCEKHHILWFADFGTLLGAVRHGGFIPWDDDLDICMLRDDWLRFREIARRELPPGYYIPQELHEDYRLQLPVQNNRNISWEKTRLEKFHGFPFTTGVDIFALDYVAPNPEDEAAALRPQGQPVCTLYGRRRMYTGGLHAPLGERRAVDLSP